MLPNKQPQLRGKDLALATAKLPVNLSRGRRDQECVVNGRRRQRGHRPIQVLAARFGSALDLKVLFGREVWHRLRRHYPHDILKNSLLAGFTYFAGLGAVDTALRYSVQ
jgi:hypothetical protein